MGVIEDTRKVAQDFLAPELRAITTRLDALEKRFEEVEKRAEQRAQDAESRAKERANDAESRARERQETLVHALAGLANYNEVRERLTRLETRNAAHQ